MAAQADMNQNFFVIFKVPYPEDRVCVFFFFFFLISRYLGYFRCTMGNNSLYIGIDLSRACLKRIWSSECGST